MIIRDPEKNFEDLWESALRVFGWAFPVTR